MKFVDDLVGVLGLVAISLSIIGPLFFDMNFGFRLWIIAGVCLAWAFFFAVERVRA